MDVIEVNGEATALSLYILLGYLCDVFFSNFLLPNALA